MDGRHFVPPRRPKEIKQYTPTFSKKGRGHWGTVGSQFWGSFNNNI
jgi:hypothetical protein